MARRCVVVTGARSRAGRVVCDALRADDGVDLVPVHSLRRDGVEPKSENALSMDLSRAFSDEARKAFVRADAVFHFSWVRSLDPNEAQERNRAQITQIMDAMAKPEGFVFISTPAATDDTLSVYGRTKMAMERLVLEKGGSVLVVGLLEDASAGGAYGAVRSAVCRSPLAVRLENAYRFYPTSTEALVGGCRFFLSGPVAGTYTAFPPQGVGAAAFIRGLEATCPRLRLPLPFHSGLAYRVVGLFESLGMKHSEFLERLCTFLHRDSRRLASLSQAGRGPENLDQA